MIKEKNRFQRIECDLYRYQSVSLREQTLVLNRINQELDRKNQELNVKMLELNDKLSEYQSARYILGSAMFDLLRYPLHPVDPMKRILRYLKDRQEAKKRPDLAPATQDGPRIKEENKDQIIPDCRPIGKKALKKWLLMCPAPEFEKTLWGDYHFCVSLAKALEKKGHSVEVRLFDNWDDPIEADVVVVLRGLHKYRPRRHANPNTLYVMWNIVHPEDVSVKEYNSFDLVFVSSYFYANVIKNSLQVPVYPLLQCTDTSRFYITENEKNQPREGLLFIGNGRLDGRMCVNWAAASGKPLKVIGYNWKGILQNAEKFVIAEGIENERIRNEYVHAAATLNDHWESMRAFQFINNRVFDALACGLPVISDSFDELRSLFPEILFYDDEVSFYECLDQLDKNYEAIRKNAERAGVRVREEHTFDVRAGTLISETEKIRRADKGRKIDRINAQGKWTVILLRKQSVPNIGHYHEMLMKCFADDDRISRIIVLDRPISQELLDRNSEEYVLSQKAEERHRGRDVSEKIVQYNYIYPEKVGYRETDYRNYIRSILKKENVGDGKTILWLCPKINEYGPALDEITADILVSDFIDDEREYADKEQQRKQITENCRAILSKSDHVFCNSEKIRKALIELCPWQERDIHLIAGAAEPAACTDIDVELPGRMKEDSHPVIGCTGNCGSMEKENWNNQKNQVFRILFPDEKEYGA